MSNIKDYGSAADKKCRSEDGYKKGLNDWIYTPNAFNQPKDFKYLCPSFVHQFYEVGSVCPEGFIVMHIFEQADGENFVQCGGIIKDAVAIGE